MTHTVVIAEGADGHLSILTAGTGGACEYPAPAGTLHRDSWPWLVSTTLREAAGQDPVTLVLPTMPHLGEVGEMMEGAGFGKVYGLQHDSGWYQICYERPERRRIILCVLDRLSGTHADSLFRAGWPGRRILANLSAVRDLLGVPFYASPGTTGITLMRKVGDRQAARIRPPWRSGELPREVAQATALTWRSPEYPATGAPTGHQWDVRAAYLAAASAATLGVDEPTLVDSPPWDRSRAGWWRIPREWAWSVIPTGAPPLWDRRAEQPDGRVWLSTPIMAEIQARRAATGANLFAPEHGLLSTQSSRLLRVWAQVIRDALRGAQLEAHPVPEVVDVLKDVYRQAVGMLASPGGSVYRRDWHCTIVDLAKVLLWRKIAHVHMITGVWPLSVATDAVIYSAETVRRWESGNGSSFGELLAVGNHIGNFRYKGLVGAEQQAGQVTA